MDEQKQNTDGLIPKHGGYRRLKTFQLATLIYDMTVRFCDKFIDRRSRAHDQMLQAARSGRQNIAEGSVDSGTSKKIELKLTGIARGGLEELRLDYEDYLRQRCLPQWPPEHPALARFRELRCSTLKEFRAWVGAEVQRERQKNRRMAGAEHGQDTDRHGRGEKTVGAGLCPSVFAANGALSLLNLCIFLLDKQMKAQAEAFEKDGGFTERLYRRRVERRNRGND